MSWKRIVRKGEDAGRIFKDDSFRLSSEVVDMHHEVNGKKTSTEHSASGCADTWRTSHGDRQKPMPHLQETGIFPLVCRHGVVFQYADIVKGGEA